MKRTALCLIFGAVIGVIFTVCVTIGYAIKKSRSTSLIPSVPQATTKALNAFLDEKSYEIGFFAKNLTTGKIIGRREDQSVCLASIVKVFCLTELYRQKHEEKLNIYQKFDVPKHGSISLKQAADLMIGQSDNDATQALAAFLGRDSVNRIPAMLGLDSVSSEILPSDNIFREKGFKEIF